MTVTVIELNAPIVVTGDDQSAPAWMNYFPSFTWLTAGGTPATFVINAARYIQIGKTVHVFCDITLSSIGIGNSGPLYITLPVASTGALFGAGREVALVGYQLAVTCSSATQMYIVNCNATHVINTGNGARFLFGATYEAA